ncbi:ROK family protein [Bacillus sp. EAC]|uniref:ROK family protein n=1 Tax=Bacillus sp. EAC TaxID=1978338 RepID=UPI000B43432C|nr:ROK family protein [Bacillus sp. EAC]
MKHYAVVDLGGSAIKYALMKEDGSFVEKGSVPTPREDIQAFINGVTYIVKNYERKVKIEGIALSMPGAVDVVSGIIGGGSAVPYIHGPNIKQLLFESTGYQVELENDANCAGLAEAWIGSARDVNDFICIVIGSGIGGVVVLDKKVRRGKNLHAGEFGCMLMKDYLNETVGKTWSDVASTSSLVQAVAKRKGLDWRTMNGKKVFELLDNGDIEVKEEVEKFIKYLAVGIFNVAYVIDPEKILIGGAISQRQELIRQINTVLATMRGEHATLDLSVERCAFENDSNLIGALFHYMQQTGVKIVSEQI